MQLKNVKSFLRRWKRNRIGAGGAIIVILVIIAALAAPLVAPYTPTEMVMTHRLKAPTTQFFFGTDNFGRDIFSRVVYGARVSLQVGMISVGIGVAGGLLLGLVSGYYGRWVDSIVMRFMDIMFAFPSILLALVVIAVLGTSLTNTMIAIGITYIPIFTRIVRSSVLGLRDIEFIEAAKALGAKDKRILFVHIVPNVLVPIVVQGTLALSGAILTEASLSFLGLGIQPPHPSWGSMLSTSRMYMELAPWTAIFPALAIMVTVLSFNLFGDGLRDVLDPRLSGQR